ncbi:hypothetical protein SAMN06265795_114116 [Noviherbaspirillum humi]|uniref:Uncharacterized protein n=1 Tax=Noviherbaspirillum humi TaxID=1688639 RepID=A0A239K2U4_9BURK|nr:hypothetical protein SAMN06265795_114116 [Noviherbaspirillum humi]
MGFSAQAHGRLFGPGLAGGGEAVSAHWHGSSLVVEGNGR